MTGVKDTSGRDIAILLKDAHLYLTDDFYMCYFVYVQSENLSALPFAGGWADQPEWILSAISILKHECATCDKEDREREDIKNKHK